MKLLLTNDKININFTSLIEKIDRQQNIRHIIEMSPLQFAIDKSQDKIIQLFLSQEFFKESEKIDINKESIESIESIIGKEIEIYKKTPLYMSIEKQNINAVKLLLARTDINVNKQSFHILDNNQIQAKAPLHLAVEIEDLEVIKLLLKKKEIDIEIEDCQGKKPIDYSKNDEIKRLLSQF